MILLLLLVHLRALLLGSLCVLSCLCRLLSLLRLRRLINSNFGGPVDSWSG